MAEVKLTNQNLSEVLSTDKPVLVDFWASWCGPCKMLAPIIEEIAEEYEGKAVVAKVNVDEEQELAMRFEISSIPTLILFKNNQAVKKTVGFMDKSSVKAFIEE